MTLCPSCGEGLVSGALRCRSCGADAREGSRVTGAGFSIASLLTPEQQTKLAALEELRALSPEILEWMRTHPKERGRLLDLLLVLYRGC